MMGNQMSHIKLSSASIDIILRWSKLCSALSGTYTPIESLRYSLAFSSYPACSQLDKQFDYCEWPS